MQLTKFETWSMWTSDLTEMYTEKKPQKISKKQKDQDSLQNFIKERKLYLLQPQADVL